MKEVRTESFIFEAIGSVSTIYQVLSLEQKSKVIFVPGLLFFLRLNIVFQPLNDTIKENHVSF
ncbi:hypothetical protein [Enterococcus faecalis]|uniref:hypothetical protein n=1 Tax=Enterococcus faecalis TaxID=1351 RepID=UPI0032B72416